MTAASKTDESHINLEALYQAARDSHHKASLLDFKGHVESLVF